MNTRNTSLGFSLVELMLALGVATILIVAGFVVYNQVTTAAKTRAAQDMVRSISAGVRALYPHADYAGLSNRVALDAGIVDESLKSSSSPTSSALRNPWGGTLTIMGTDQSTALNVCGPDAGGARCTHFRIVMNSVPSEACVSMLTGMGSEYEIIWAIHAGETSVAENLLDGSGQPDIDRIVAACNDADPVNIRFVGR